MNAGRDVERLVSSWLVDEAAVGAPDRVLEKTRRTLDRTPQRRFAAAWREPVNLSFARVAAMAAALVLAVGAGAWLGRATAPAVVGPAAPASTSPVPAATGDDAAATATFKAARNDICTRYAAEIGSAKDEVVGIFDESTSEPDRATKVLALTNYVNRAASMIGELGALQAPPALAAAHGANVTQYKDVTALIRQALALVQSGDLHGAGAVDAASNPLGADMASYEARHGLVACP